MPAFPYDLTQLDNQFCTPGIPNLLIRGRFHSDKTRVNRKAPSLRVGKVRTGGEKGREKDEVQETRKKGAEAGQNNYVCGFDSLFVASRYGVQCTEND